MQYTLYKSCNLCCKCNTKCKKSRGYTKMLAGYIQKYCNCTLFLSFKKILKNEYFLRSADAILLFFYAHLPRVGRAEGLQKRPRFCVFGENLMKLRKRIVLRIVLFFLPKKSGPKAEKYLSMHQKLEEFFLKNVKNL